MNGGVVEAGCDEAGRGCLAGPVFAAAVVLPTDFYHPKLNDSKRLSAKDRDELRPLIEEAATGYSVEIASVSEIDQINILNASFLAMTRAINALKVVPEHLLIDGNRFRTDLEIPYTCVIQGDGMYASIAAASILAKTYRDDYMKELSTSFPEYGWANNKGYGTVAHRMALQRYGPTMHHRKSFVVKKQLKLPLE